MVMTEYILTNGVNWSIIGMKIQQRYEMHINFIILLGSKYDFVAEITSIYKDCNFLISCFEKSYCESSKNNEPIVPKLLVSKNDSFFIMFN